MPAPAAPAEGGTHQPAAARWSARRLLTQPHRLCFAAAAVVWAASALFWLLALSWPAAVPAAVPADALHALAFTLGPMPLFFAGFLFTSAPKWLRRPELPTATLAPGVAAIVLGWLLLLALGPWSARSAALALALCSAGWLALWLRLLGLRRGATRTSGHFIAIAAACGLIGLALVAAAMALLADASGSARAIARMALWGAVLPVFLLAAHRLLPFLAHADAPRPQAGDAAADPEASGTAGHPLWVPALPLAASLLTALAAWPGWPATLIAGAWPLRSALPAAAAALTLWLAWRWSAHPATHAPLLRRLLRAFAWSGLGWLALAAAALPLWPAVWRVALEAAGLHAMALGFAGGTMLTMVTRLSAAQAGQARAVDALTRRSDQWLQVALGARLLAAFWPPLGRWALPAAALVWALIALAWLWRHGRFAGQGRPGRHPGRE